MQVVTEIAGCGGPSKQVGWKTCLKPQSCPPKYIKVEFNKNLINSIKFSLSTQGYTYFMKRNGQFNIILSKLRPFLIQYIFDGPPLSLVEKPCQGLPGWKDLCIQAVVPLNY